MVRGTGERVALDVAHKSAKTLSPLAAPRGVTAVSATRTMLTGAPRSFGVICMQFDVGQQCITLTALTVQDDGTTVN